MIATWKISNSFKFPGDSNLLYSVKFYDIEVTILFKKIWKFVKKTKSFLNLSIFIFNLRITYNIVFNSHEISNASSDKDYLLSKPKYHQFIDNLPIRR